ncbi:MAG: DUF6356 family protein [Pseudomonadota bacterium]
MVRKLFNDHPASVGESYWQHMGVAFSFAGSMIAAGFACFIHGLFPFLFVKTGSRTITGLHDRMVLNRSRHRQVGAGAEQRQSLNWQI